MFYLVKFICYCSTPLPPLPSDKRLLMENGSNRSSGSSGNYGHLIDHSTADYDNIYTKPTVLKLISMLVPSKEAFDMHEVRLRDTLCRFNTK